MFKFLKQKRGGTVNGKKMSEEPTGETKVGVPLGVSTEKRDFDLEIVLDGFQRCYAEDGSILIKHYVTSFTELCRFFKLTGTLFSFVASDLEDKISILSKLQNSHMREHYVSAQTMTQFEVENDLTRVQSELKTKSGSRTLLRLHRALEFILIFMQRLIHSADDASTAVIASEVYHETLANYHIWIVRKMAGLAMYMLPTRRQLVDIMCKQEFEKVVELTDQVVKAAQPIYDTTQALYEQHNILDLP